MSEGYTGNYAPNLFNEQKRYFLFQPQEQATLTDAELRDMGLISNTNLRRVIQEEVGDSAIRDGFKIAEHPTDSTQNFLITGGDGTLDNPGVMFLKGYRLSLRGGIGYKDQVGTGTLTDDGYTKTVLPALTEPTGTKYAYNGVVVNSGKTFVVGLADNVLKSTDYGRNFHDKACVAMLYGVTSADATSFYAAGRDHVSTKPALMRSIDSGETWTNLNGNSIFNDGTPDGTFFGVDFINTSVGYFVGTSGQIYFSSDSGGLAWGTWTKQNPINVGDNTNNLRSVNALDNTNVWVVGDNYTVLHSSDALTWVSKTPVTGTPVNFNSVQAMNSTTAYVCGNSGRILKTVDTGENWSEQASDTTVNLNSIFFLNSTTGWAVGDGGVITRTLNGSTWDSTIINSLYDFKSVYFIDTTGFIAAGKTIDGTGYGEIYRTVDGISWEPYRTDHVYVDFHLAEVSGDITSGSEYTDSTLVDPLMGLPSANRLRIVQDVKVSEGWPTPTDYTSSDGTTVVQHHTYTLATIYRQKGYSAIRAEDITDSRAVVRTVAELDYALKNGGVDASSLASGSITPDKMDSGADYILGSLRVLRDTTVGGNLRIDGFLSADSTVSTSITNKLIVQGSSSLGDLISPYDSSTAIYGNIIQNNDTSRVAYNIHSASTTLNAPVINVLQDGSGSILKVVQTNGSGLPLVDVSSSTSDYDISIRHSGETGGIIRSHDNSINASYLITKDATTYYAPVMDITTNAYGPAITVHNTALCNTASIGIDQSSGSALDIKAQGDASSIVINSSSSGTDLKIRHTGSSGYIMDATGSGSGVFNIRNNKGPLGVFTQKANEDLFLLTKDSTGSGRVVEVYHSGVDPAVQINTLGKGIGLHVSHTGDSSSPGVDIFVAGNETGPALRVTKANNDSSADVGQAVYIVNSGFSQAVQILQDNTDSTSALFQIENYSSGLDASAINWSIDKSGNLNTNGDITASQFSFDSNFYLSAEKFFLDASNFDASNPGIAGRVFQEGGFLRFSDGTEAFPVGLTATGSFTNFTIKNGLIIAAS